jgi:Uma2 family endonuclease
MKAALLDELMKLPDLPLCLDRVREALEEERSRREAFHESVREDDKAEFINGEVIVHSPVKRWHNRASFRLAYLLETWVSRHELGEVHHEKAMIRLRRNSYEPDVCFFSKKKAESFEPDLMLFPAPDFIAEVVSPSTEARDRGVKMLDYAAHGVAEYWIVDPDAKTIEQYLLRVENEGENQYELRAKTSDGNLRSEAVAGFAINAAAVFDDAKQREAMRDMLVNSEKREKQQ